MFDVLSRVWLFFYHVDDVSAFVIDPIVKPSFTRTLKETADIKGSFAHLECSLSGSLLMLVLWYKDERERS